MAGQKNADAFGVVRARQRFRRFTYSDFEKYFRKVRGTVEICDLLVFS